MQFNSLSIINFFLKSECIYLEYLDLRLSQKNYHQIQNMINDYERGKRCLTPDMAKRIAETLNIKVERIS
ncbi:MAG: helix-turn-helix transcriptional regulator [Proteobacteria bacterium]|nr:helix-turn-helix transcriptional regulator [Pseudomonadota bacterium]MBU1387012.1 helix-turn-helix transcriptional regulator [Pseudomonadota bacterium]MBU1542307.1 helix-turn-helix transcriptional regulator [Pseudomonadota bacterium]